VDFSDINPGLACENGGISIFTFQDLNSDGDLQSSEPILKVKSVCNGTNGTNGSNGVNASITLESVASSYACPSGGVKIKSSDAIAIEVCNGVNGLNGDQGVPGMQGLPGMAGTNGTNGTSITPVKFCNDDNSTFPEYGLLIGDDLFAVYWGTTPSSPKVAQAFLTKLVPGKYMSTGGNNCLFAID